MSASGAAPERRRYTGVAFAVAITALLAVYAFAIVVRATQLLRTGDGVAVALGVTWLVLPLIVIGLIVREWLLAWDVQRMADTLAAEGGLPVDDLPRSPGGRVDRGVARERFGPARQDVEAAPGDWRAWYRLAFAYDAAGDRKAARGALRTASRLHRGRGTAAV